MDTSQLFYAGVMLLGVFLASVSQVLLKKAANKHPDSLIKEYLNPLVIGAYAMFFITTLMCIYAYKGIDLSLGPVLEATSYIYIAIFGVLFFKEKQNVKTILAIVLIVAGILVFSFC